MYVDRLEIENFRCFEHTDFRLVHPDRTDWGDLGEPVLKNVNLFLGDNGSGKSSVFKAVAIGVLGQLIGTQTEYLVRRSAHSTSPEAQLTTLLRTHNRDPYTPSALPNLVDNRVYIKRSQDVDYIQTRFVDEAYWDSIHVSNSSSYFMVGYGVNRRNERPEGYSEATRLPRYQRVAGLFEDHVGLAPFTYAYLQIKDHGSLTEARDLLNKLLPDLVTLTKRTDGQNRPVFDVSGVDLPFNVLPDGIRIFIGWVWDLIYQLSVLLDLSESSFIHSLTDFEGLCIVDEIDLLLHPEWQRTVVKQVAEAFPKIQFLFSTHSPIVAGTLDPANIFVLDDNKVEQYRENIHGLTPNQILTSSYFGLSSTRAPGTGTLSDQARKDLGIDESDPNPLASAAVRETVQRLIANGVISAQVPQGPQKPSRRKSTPE